MQSYNCLPLNYSIHFFPDLHTFQYKAIETLTFSVDKNTSFILLDAINLQLTSCKLLVDSGNIVSWNVNQVDKQVILTFAKQLNPGIHSIEIIYSSLFSDGLAGWYKSSYQTEEKTKYLITSHFEPADARSVFPCIDNPSCKATFDICVTIDENLTAVSNMPIESEKKEPENKKKIIFQQTPKMSTYLLYIGIGEFEYIEGRYNDIPIKVYTTPGKKQHAHFAIECTKQFLGYLEEYFLIPFALPKIDLLAIPDFGAGAMEQWGAITFRENLLLYYENTSSTATKQSIAEVIAHELAHQWFGNLVTMQWWNDLWLNESFATFLAYKIVDHYYPEWHIWSNYITEMVFGGMDLDSLQSSHPIQVEIQQVEQIDELFDEIAYDKGGSILRMLEEYVGAVDFCQGLREYMSAFAYKNTQGKDLWNSLERVSKNKISELMQSFIIQKGFPHIKLTMKNNSLQLNQKKFSFLNESTVQTWTIPLIIDTGNEIQRTLFSSESMTIPLTNPAVFINLNKEYAGFYITEYDKSLTKKLAEHTQKLNYTDKLGIIHDQFFLTLSNMQSLKIFTHFLKTCFFKETDPSVLYYIISRLTRIYLLIEDEEIKKMTQQLSRHSLSITGYNPLLKENPHINYLRNAALYSSSLFNDTEVIQFANESFKKSLIDQTTLHPDLKGIIYALAVWSDDTHYEIVKSKYLQTQIQEEKAKYLSALGNSKNKKLLFETLEFCLTPDVRFAHILYLISGISRNPHGKEVVIDWLINNWGKLTRENAGMHMILRHLLKMVIPICGTFNKKKTLDFLTNHRMPGLEKTFEQLQEELLINLTFVNRNKTPLTT